MAHANGTDGSTTFIDSSVYGRTLTAVGNAQIDTAQSKFGGASALMDGTGDKVTAAAVSAWVGAGDFTVEGFVRYNSVLGTPAIFGQYVDANNFWYLRKGGFYLKSAGVEIANYTWTDLAIVNTWYHMMLVRNGTTIKVFQDGVAFSLTETTAIASQSLPDFAANFVIGDSSDTDNDPLNGLWDEVRISRGIARQTGNFTPPSGEYSP